MTTSNDNDQFISVVNNSEFYKINKYLTEGSLFELDDMSAIAKINDDKKDIRVEITEYDIVKNPSLIMQTTSKKEIVSKVTERLENLDQNTRDTYLIMFAHWEKYRTKEAKEEPESCYLTLDQIHFGYRGLTGKNRDSTLTKDQYSTYITSIDILTNTKVKIDITKESNVAYDKIKNLGWGAIEGFLVDNVRWIYDDRKEKILGVKYDMGIVSDAYVKYVPQINNKYPSALLRLDSKQSVVKNIGNYLCYLHRCNKNSKNLVTTLNFYNLLGEARFEIKAPRYQQYIDRFINHLKKARDLLIENRIISNMDIPSDIHSKNYKEKNILIKWTYLE